MVLLFLSGFILQGQVFAGSAGRQASDVVAAGTEILSPTDPKKMEINRLQQDISASKAEIEVINEQKETLHTKMRGLESRILELKRRLLEKNKPTDDPDRR